jgi:hypothetical protein
VWTVKCGSEIRAHDKFTLIDQKKRKKEKERKKEREAIVDHDGE